MPGSCSRPRSSSPGLRSVYRGPGRRRASRRCSSGTTSPDGSRTSMRPQDLQYAAGHRNSPGKYLLELPLYLWPWTLLAAAALRRAWQASRAGAAGAGEMRPVRFALATALPSLALLSVAATARNIYLAPALPGFALLLGWWASLNAPRPLGCPRAARHRLSAAHRDAGVCGRGSRCCLHRAHPWARSRSPHLACSSPPSLRSGPTAAARHDRTQHAQLALLLAYCVLLIVPAWPALSRS